MPKSLQELVNDARTQTAKDGEVIKSEYHNTLRDAVVAIAEQLGAGPASRSVVESHPPHFLQNAPASNWVQTNGVATGVPSNATEGYFALHLPQGSRIQSMTVAGRRTGNSVPFSVKLLRVTVTDGSSVELITVLLGTAPDPFKVQQTVAVRGAGLVALEEYKKVDNNMFTYLVLASSTPGAADLVQLNGIQISYTLS